MEEDAAIRIQRLAQIEHQRLFLGGKGDAQPLALPENIPLQRRGGRFRRQNADGLAHKELAPDETQTRVIAHADCGTQGFVQLLQTGKRSSPQAGKPFRQTHALNQMRGGTVQPLFAQEPRRPMQPARRAIRLRAVMPEKFIPCRRGHARRIAVFHGKIGIAPERPGSFDLFFRQPFQQSRVFFGRRHAFQRGHMPCPADNGDFLMSLFLRPPQTGPHGGFPQGFEPRPPPFRLRALPAQFAHHERHGLEQFRVVQTLFHKSGPPGLPVLEPGKLSEPAERVKTQQLRRIVLRFLRPLRFSGVFRVLVVREFRPGFARRGLFRRKAVFLLPCLFQRKTLRQRQIHAVQRDSLPHGVQGGLPFGRKGRIGIEDRPPGIGLRIDQQGHRRFHALPGKGKELFRLGRPLQQQTVRLPRMQRPAQAPGTAGAVMPYAENPYFGSHARYSVSRQAR